MPATASTPDPGRHRFALDARAAAAVRGVLHGASAPLTLAQVAAAFGGPAGKRAGRVAELLETLAALGQAVAVAGGRYAAG